MSCMSHSWFLIKCVLFCLFLLNTTGLVFYFVIPSPLPAGKRGDVTETVGGSADDQLIKLCNATRWRRQRNFVVDISWWIFPFSASRRASALKLWSLSFLMHFFKKSTKTTRACFLWSSPCCGFDRVCVAGTNRTNRDCKFQHFGYDSRASLRSVLVFIRWRPAKIHKLVFS